MTDLCCTFAEHTGLAFICATVFLVELTFEATIVESLNAYLNALGKYVPYAT
jgi:hypothetical protein